MEPYQTEPILAIFPSCCNCNTEFWDKNLKYLYFMKCAPPAMYNSRDHLALRHFYADILTRGVSGSLKVGWQVVIWLRLLFFQKVGGNCPPPPFSYAPGIDEKVTRRFDDIQNSTSGTLVGCITKCSISFFLGRRPSGTSKNRNCHEIQGPLALAI